MVKVTPVIQSVYTTIRCFLAHTYLILGREGTLVIDQLHHGYYYYCAIYIIL